MNHRVTIRLTPAQAVRVDALAASLQVPVAEVLRQSFEFFSTALSERSASAPKVAASHPVPLGALADGAPESAPARPRQGVTYAELLARIRGA